MAANVLVAEDSLTVQKVISFTLENEPFDLNFCKNEEELFAQFKKGRFHLVFLDINLSSSKTGEELARELKSIDPDIQILALFGTFDIIDENSLEKAGISEKIVKPFESVEFIEVCHKMVGDHPVRPVEVTSMSSPEDDEWTLNAPVMEEVEEEKKTLSKDDQELMDWEVEIPNIIKEEPPLVGEEAPSIPEDNSPSIPEEKPHTIPVDESLLEEGAELMASINQTKAVEEEFDEISLPSEEDLEFPEEKGKDDSPPSLDQEVLFEETKEINAPRESKFDLEEEVKEDLSPDDFWAMDEKSHFIGNQDDREPPEKISPQTGQFKLSPEDIEIIITAIRPLIRQEVRRYGLKTLERVAWEVIPDLAENLIRKELKDISKMED